MILPESKTSFNEGHTFEAFCGELCSGSMTYRFLTEMDNFCDKILTRHNGYISQEVFLIAFQPADLGQQFSGF